MAFLNRFKKDSKKAKRKDGPQDIESAKEGVSSSEVRRKDGNVPKAEKKSFSFLGSAGKIGPASLVLQRPHMSEKAVSLSSRSQYIFEVPPRAKKLDIKEAVQKSYGVEVRMVHIVRIPPKPRRLGRSEGYKPGYKKAIVTLQAGQAIEVSPH